MVMFKAHTKAAGMIVAAALLAALCTAFAHHCGLCVGGGKPLYEESESFAREIFATTLE